MEQEICFRCLHYRRGTKGNLPICKIDNHETHSQWRCWRFTKKNHQTIISSSSPTLVHCGGK